MLCKNATLKDFVKLTGKPLRWSLSWTQENPCVGVSVRGLQIAISKDYNTSVFLLTLENFQEHFFMKHLVASASDCSPVLVQLQVAGLKANKSFCFKTNSLFITAPDV